MLTDPQNQERNDLIAGLREIADWLEQRPELKAPWFMLKTMNLWATSREDLIRLRRITGATEKVEWGTGSEWMAIRRSFGGGFTLDVNIRKEHTCTRIKIGEKVSPAHDGFFIAAKPETVDPVYQWVCDEPLLAGVESSADLADSLEKAVLGNG